MHRVASRQALISKNDLFGALDDRAVHGQNLIDYAPKERRKQVGLRPGD